ncbi:MAG: hypothetical protein JWM21_1612 [Acidobacteria bacterium]|nr:hypothetical protein [Acidobacteriota bacterium]
MRSVPPAVAGGSAPEQDRWATDPLGVIAAPTTTHPLPQVVLTSFLAVTRRAVLSFSATR